MVLFQLLSAERVEHNLILNISKSSLGIIYEDLISWSNKSDSYLFAFDGSVSQKKKKKISEESTMQKV